MLIGYVSDEHYLALEGVAVELERDGTSIAARSRATGAIHADITAGVEYRVTLAKDGFGAKTVAVTFDPAEPYAFRLLSDCLLGYMWPKWARAGESSEFRVHSPEAYKLELFRYGWTKELVRTIGWYDEHGPRATVQITPDGDYAASGVEWNRHGYRLVHHPQHVVAPERSGLYYFHASTACGRFFSFPWIVAPQKPTAKIAVLASNLTWNAYNNLGGRSNYILNDLLPRRPVVNARLDLERYTNPNFGGWEAATYRPLSLDRPEPLNSVPQHEQPTDPIEGRLACAATPAEWRLLAWLEREGFAYDYYAETQLHAGELPLDDYRVLVMSVHPEYWTRQMYASVKDWVTRRGGKLVYLGGNGINCEVELLDDHRVVHHNGRAADVTAGKFESRFHMRVESEANLLGVVFTDTGIMSAAPYEAIEAGHWALAGTGLAPGDHFGLHSQHMRCPGGASGHEQDKVSPSSPKQVQVLARGLNPNDGGAHLAYYETDSGGAVFSAGSIIWPACLLVDHAVSKITANVFARFTK